MHNKERQKAWRLAHPDAVRAYRKKYNLSHKEETCATQKAWQLAHPETIRAWREKYKELKASRERGYRAADPEKKRAACRAYYAAHREHRDARNQARRIRYKLIGGTNLDYKELPEGYVQLAREYDDFRTRIRERQRAN